MLTPRGRIMEHFAVAHANVSTAHQKELQEWLLGNLFTHLAVVQVNICTNQL